MQGFLSYSPHNGLGDQCRQLALARALAETLQRTLVLPRLLGHFDATALQVAAERETRLASFIERLRRPHLSSLLNASKLGVPTVEYSELPNPINLPPCFAANGTQLIWSEQPEDVLRKRHHPRCVHHVEPPRLYASVSEHLFALQRKQHVPWLHFRSMLWVHSEKAAKRNPLSAWEEQMLPTACVIRYRRDVMDSANAAFRSMLRRVISRQSHPPLPPSLAPLQSYPSPSAIAIAREDTGNTAYFAAHVRALREAQSKGESEDEWITRLTNFAASRLRRQRRASLISPHRSDDLTGADASHSRPETPPMVLYLATDHEPRRIVPQAAAALARFNVTVVSRADVEPEALRSIHPESATAALALDVASCLGAEGFSPSPRSGLSVHLIAMRACERRGEPCTPHACVAYASTACGGRFPYVSESTRDAPRHGPHSQRCKAMRWPATSRTGWNGNPSSQLTASQRLTAGVHGPVSSAAQRSVVAAVHDAKMASARGRLKSAATSVRP